MKNMRIEEFSPSWVMLKTVDEFENCIRQHQHDTNKTLCLDLSWHRARDQDIKRIAALLAHDKCPKGTHINLSCNNMTGSHIKYLAEALISPNCPEDLTLHLSANNTGDEGANYFATALQSRNCPKGLGIDLYANSITAVGIGYFVQALNSKNCPIGLKLNLSGNTINSEAILTIGNALNNCPDDLLLDLQLSTDACRDKEVAREFIKLIEENNYPKNLRLNLKYTVMFRSKEYFLLASALKKNTSISGIEFEVDYGSESVTIRHCLRRNHYLAKYPHLEKYIKSISAEMGNYTPTHNEQLISKQAYFQGLFAQQGKPAKLNDLQEMQLQKEIHLAEKINTKLHRFY